MGAYKIPCNIILIKISFSHGNCCNSYILIYRCIYAVRCNIIVGYTYLRSCFINTYSYCFFRHISCTVCHLYIYNNIIAVMKYRNLSAHTCNQISVCCCNLPCFIRYCSIIINCHYAISVVSCIIWCIY